MSRYLDFQRLPSTGVTEVCAVNSKRSGDNLGFISWYSPWRQYAFRPAPSTVWNPECLDDVNNKIRELTDDRKARLARR